MSCINCPRRSLGATQTLNSSLCFQVGFFPSQCVEVIGDKTDGQTPLPATKPSPHMTPGMFNLDSIISLLKLCRFMFNSRDVRESWPIWNCRRRKTTTGSGKKWNRDQFLAFASFDSDSHLYCLRWTNIVKNFNLEKCHEGHKNGLVLKLICLPC